MIPSPFIISIIVSCLFALGLGIQTKRMESCKTDHAQFVATLAAQAAAQIAANKIKEAADAKKIQDALSERDAALKRLRDNRSPVSLSASPVAPAGSQEFSLDSASFNAAVGRYRERLERGLAGIQSVAVECGAVEIDAKALLDSWPTSTPP